MAGGDHRFVCCGLLVRRSRTVLRCSAAYWTEMARGPSSGGVRAINCARAPSCQSETSFGVAGQRKPTLRTGVAVSGLPPRAEVGIGLRHRCSGSHTIARDSPPS